MSLNKVNKKVESEIRDVLAAFAEASWRELEVRADAVQLRGAPGFLINEFLFPFYMDQRLHFGRHIAGLRITKPLLSERKEYGSYSS